MHVLGTPSLSAMKGAVKKVQRGSGGRPAVIGKAEMAVFPQDDMIQKGNAQQLSALT